MDPNSPYVGASMGTGGPADDLTMAQRRRLQTRVSSVAARTRELLPDEYAVGSSVHAGMGGVRVTVSVRPPVGNPVSAGLDPDLDADEPIPAEDVAEVARGLAASAALQVKRAMGDEITQTAR